MCRSVPQIAVFSSLIRTSFGPGAGTGTCSIQMPLVASRLTSAFIVCDMGLPAWRAATGAARGRNYTPAPCRGRSCCLPGTGGFASRRRLLVPSPPMPTMRRRIALASVVVRGDERRSVQRAVSPACRQSSVPSVQRVVEGVEMRAALGDVDLHAPAQASEFVGTAVGNDGERQRGPATIHHAAVLHHETALAALQRANEMLDGDIAGRTRGGIAGAEHLHHAGRVQFAVEALLEADPGEGGIATGIDRIHRGALDVEGALDLLAHGSRSVCGGGAHRTRPLHAVSQATDFISTIS